MKQIDAKGLACPQPVILAKQALDRGENVFAIVVDNKTAVENLTRLAESNGCRVSVEEAGDVYTVHFARDGGAPASGGEMAQAKEAVSGKWAVLVPSDTLGRGDAELGASLIKMFFYTLTQDSDIPGAILFVNAGVTLACNEEVAEHLCTLAEKGCEILVCGTCLNYYGLKEELKVGVVSNMYDILQRMKDVSKVITL